MKWVTRWNGHVDRVVCPWRRGGPLVSVALLLSLLLLLVGCAAPAAAARPRFYEFYSPT